MGKITEWIKEYKSFIMYIIFGVLTTVINLAAYAACYEGVGLGNVASTVIAWIVAVIVAYVTNKIWVFESRSLEFRVVLYEVLTFFGCRILTGVLDIAIMYVSVDVYRCNAMIFKFLSNVIVILLNFVASKLIIFVKK